MNKPKSKSTSIQNEKLTWPKKLILFCSVLVVVWMYVFLFLNKDKKGGSDREVVAIPTPLALTDREKELNYFYAVKDLNRGNYEDAEKQLEVVTQTDPTRYVAFYLLGFAQRRLGANKTAFQNIKYYLEKSLKTDPYRLYALVEICYIAEQMQDCKTAKKYRDQAVQGMDTTTNQDIKDTVNLLKKNIDAKCGQ